MNIYIVRYGKDDETIRDGWSNYVLMTVGIERVNGLMQ